MVHNINNTVALKLKVAV